MGIHHTYKSQRGERSLRKQQKQDQLRQKAELRKHNKNRKENENIYVVPENEVVTLDTLTNPVKK